MSYMKLDLDAQAREPAGQSDGRAAAFAVVVLGRRPPEPRGSEGEEGRRLLDACLDSSGSCAES